MENKRPSIWRELRDAGLGVLAALAGAAVVLYAGAVLLIAAGSTELATLGELGDSFGVLTSFFNAMAFGAVVATVVLQSRELRDSRKQLEEQAKAQRAWAEAAAKQIELARPVIKVEWHPHDHRIGVYLRMRNVGLGAGVVESVELVARDKDFGIVFGSDDADSEGKWANSLNHALGESVLGSKQNIFVLPFTDLNRALAPLEHQGLVLIELEHHKFVAPAIEILERRFRPTIYFRSLSGAKISTSNQFEAIREADTIR